MFESENEYIFHFLATDYNADIDHKLDEMRFHRSRVNYVNKVTPINISRKLHLEYCENVEVFTPFNDEKSLIEKR